MLPRVCFPHLKPSVSSSAPVELSRRSFYIEYKKLENQILAQTEARSDDGAREGDEYDNEGAPSRLCRSVEADGLFVRVLVNFNPHEVTDPSQVIPRSAISMRSGDILQLINMTDREWWQVRHFIPSSLPLIHCFLVSSIFGRYINAF